MSKKKHKVVDKDELDKAGKIITNIEGREVAIFNVNGEYHAILNFCIHQSGPLCEGNLTKGQMKGNEDDYTTWEYDPNHYSVECPWHGWRFDITTGENLSDNRYQVPTYDIEIEDEAIYIII